MRLSYRGLSLGQITGGTLGAGVVPYERLFRALARNQNNAIVTVLAADTTVVSLGSQNVVSGDIIHVVATLEIVKGGVAGTIDAFVAQLAGTATIFWGLAGVSIEQRTGSIGAGATTRLTLAGYAEVNASGTCELALRSASAGSNSTVAIGKGQMSGLILVGH